MSRFEGADVEELDDFGIACIGRGHRVSALLADLGPRVMDESVWVGEDADQWRAAWRRLSPQLGDLGSLLRNAGRDARDQSEEQNRTSGVDGILGGHYGPGTSGPGGSGPGGAAPAPGDAGEAPPDLVGKILPVDMYPLNDDFRDVVGRIAPVGGFEPIGELLADSLQADSPFEAMLAASRLLEGIESVLTAGVVDATLSGDRLAALLGLAQVDLVDSLQNLMMLATIADLVSTVEEQAVAIGALSEALGTTEAALQPPADVAGVGEALGTAAQDLGAGAGAGEAGAGGEQAPTGGSGSGSGPDAGGTGGGSGSGPAAGGPGAGAAGDSGGHAASGDRDSGPFPATSLDLTGARGDDATGAGTGGMVAAPTDDGLTLADLFLALQQSCERLVTRLGGSA